MIELRGLIGGCRAEEHIGIRFRDVEEPLRCILHKFSYNKIILNDLESIKCLWGDVSEDGRRVYHRQPDAHLVNSVLIAQWQLAFSIKHGTEVSSVENYNYPNALDMIFEVKISIERDF
ncbi:hypothetical protein EVAR_84731_1 [Eumeta japonica]|uniref:Uncharacterized protein n=1 Tax=Eumeta variegata TaxID=151549 RepID=A0A4C1VSS7_EUMVA|nr:hypothetical protein EVAR_84731_1 [Eumeta japonica]